MERLLRTFTFLSCVPLVGLLLLGTVGIGVLGVGAATQTLRLWLAGGLLMLSVLLGCIGVILVGFMLYTRRWDNALQVMPKIAVSLLPACVYILILWSLRSN